MKRTPNIIERLEQIDAACADLLESRDGDPEVQMHTDNIEGIVGEILTLIDGR